MHVSAKDWVRATLATTLLKMHGLLETIGSELLSTICTLPRSFRAHLVPFDKALDLVSVLSSLQVHLARPQTVKFALTGQDRNKRAHSWE
jgi:hypothetical protein